MYERRTGPLTEKEDIPESVTEQMAGRIFELKREELTGD
jgi:hypothetical protein